MLNLYPYLCDDPDMDLSPIREKSERLYHDILRERAFYAEHPECQNVHFFHVALQCDKTSYWADRWGVAVLSYKHGRWQALRSRVADCPAMRLSYTKGYKYFCYKLQGMKKCMVVHQLIADAFLPNTDFTKGELDHLNGEHLDNNALNLERVSHEENIRRYQVSLCLKKGQPIPWKYQSLKNYLIYLQHRSTLTSNSAAV